MNEVAILSGKGGTGKTSLGAALATCGSNIIVADCDVDAANLHLVLLPEDFTRERFISGHKAVIDYESCTACGICMEYCRFDAISLLEGTYRISETACDGCKLCARICPSQSITMVPSDKSYWFVGNFRNGVMIHARLAPGEENSGKLVNVVREQARKAAQEKGWDNILIDGPPGTGCATISAMTGAKKVILVTEPSLSGFHDLKRIMELTTHFHIQPFVVINKYDLNPEIAAKVEKWCVGQGVPVIGRLPFNPAFVHAMLECKSILEWEPDSEVSKEIRNIYHTVFQNTPNNTKP